MRLYEIEHILREILPLFEVGFEPVKGTNQSKIEGLPRLVDAVNQVADAGVFPGLVKEALDIPEFFELTNSQMNSFDTVVWTGSSVSKLQQVTTKLKTQTRILVGALSSIKAPEADDQIAVKLPEQMDLQSIGDALLDLDKILNQALVNKYIKGKIEVRGFDRGSEWILIAFSSPIAIHVVGQMVRLYFSMKEKQLEIDAKRESFKSLNIRRESLEDLRGALKKELDLHYKLELDAVLKAGKIPEEEHELIERIKLSIKMLSELFEKGLEIHPSLAVPSQTRILFPQLPKYLREPSLLGEGGDSDEVEDQEK